MHYMEILQMMKVLIILYNFFLKYQVLSTMGKNHKRGSKSIIEERKIQSQNQDQRIFIEQLSSEVVSDHYSETRSEREESKPKDNSDQSRTQRPGIKKRQKPSNPRTKNVEPNIIRIWLKTSKMIKRLNLNMTFRKNTLNKTFLIYIALKGKEHLNYVELQELKEQFRVILQKGIKFQEKKLKKGQRIQYHRENLSCYLRVMELIQTLLESRIDRRQLRKILQEQFIENVKIGECQGKNGVLTTQHQKVQTSLKFLTQNCQLEVQQLTKMNDLEEQLLEQSEQSTEMNFLEEDQQLKDERPSIPLSRAQEYQFAIKEPYEYFSYQELVASFKILSVQSQVNIQSQENSFDQEFSSKIDDKI